MSDYTTVPPGSRSVPSAAAEAQSILTNKVSWGAIFAGVAVGLIVQVLLTLLGLGVGIGTLNPGTSDNPGAETFSIVAGVWYILSGVLAAYVGGNVAARMSGKTSPIAGALHGLTTWAFTTLVVLWLLTSAVGGIVGGAFNGVTSLIGGATRTAAQTAAPMLANANPLEAISSQIRATGTDPEALNTAAMNAMRALVMGDPANAETARTEAARALANARQIPLPEAEAQVARMEEQYRAAIESARAEATKAAQTAASVASTGALVAFLALVIGGIAGWFGGRAGSAALPFGSNLARGMTA